jgi:hypothetical protein
MVSPNWTESSGKKELEALARLRDQKDKIKKDRYGSSRNEVLQAVEDNLTLDQKEEKKNQLL